VRFSVVIPTYQRRDVVAGNVAALQRQEYSDFEVIVVVDGSTDGTAAALGTLRLPFPLTVIEQKNSGGAAARNAGASAAEGELLLFLDDDMEAHPSLLAEHDRSHREGADVVLGHLPLHPASPRTLLSEGVALWAEHRRERLAARAGDPPLNEFLTGQLSISREAYEGVGGFDVGFTRGGLFGGEDLDFGYRVLRAGWKVIFNPNAVSHQLYIVDPATYLRRSREAGRAAQELIIKHPERAAEFGHPLRFLSMHSRVVLTALAAAPPWVTAPLRSLAADVMRGGRRGWLAHRLFFTMRNVEQHRGARTVRRDARRAGPVVLAYHSISDLEGHALLSEYGVPPAAFEAQLDALARRGYRFVGLETLLRVLDGDERPARRTVLVTFDDAYDDLLTEGCPRIAERCMPAVAFAVSDCVGQTNRWDATPDARPIPLLDAQGLSALLSHGVEIGSHGASHRSLVEVDPSELHSELTGSADQLERLGLPRPTVLSYPYGEWSPTLAPLLREAGYKAAFTVKPGGVGPGVDRYAVPRVEVFASDTPAKLLLKVATAGWPRRRRRWLWRSCRIKW
jgi:peptidoglycan/xylan/chitin deacetylase (PgdA/CDA1 family)